jgi:twitching motility two-component system response regulator PilH
MKKVLVVDDSEVDRTHLGRILSDAGVVVSTACSGNEALTKARENRPDLMMLDVNMPGLDGFSTARQLAADPATRGIGVIFVTSKDQKADRVFAQMLGAKGFVVKPYTAADIVSKL